MSLLITHVTQYTGPGALPVLLRDHDRVFCHDRSFADPERARRFMAEHSKAIALGGQTPESIVDELAAQGVEIDAVIQGIGNPTA